MPSDSIILIMSNSLNLFRLQKIDSRIKEASSRKAAIQSILDNNDEIQSASKRIEQTQSSLRQAESNLRKSELDASAIRTKLEQSESSLYSGRIQNPKELQDLQKDIMLSKRNLNNLEDQQLENMLTLENCQLELDNAKKNFGITQGKIISANAGLKTELDSLQKELSSLDAQRQAVLPGIDSESLRFYDTLRQKRSGLAVSQVIDNACNTCGSTLAPGFAQSVRTSAHLVFCPMCGRILYSN